MRTFFTLLLILINSSVLADEKASFCGDATEDMKILGVFPIIKAGNFKDFIDSNQNSRTSAVKSFADISTKLLSIEDTPIKPDQIKNLLLFFSDFHDYMVSASDKGIGLALSDLTLSEIEALYARTSVSPIIKFNFFNQTIHKTSTLPSMVATASSIRIKFY